MPDFSLIFFGAIILSLLIYVIINLIKSPNKKDSILNILIWLALAFSIAYISYSENAIQAFVYLLSISFIALFSIAFLNIAIDSVLVSACISRALKKLHAQEELDLTDIFKLKRSTLYSNKTWYIVYSTANGFTLIGINKFKEKPHADKKFNLKALSGENYCAESINPFREEDIGKVAIICPLKEFYDSGEENRKIVHAYLLKLKNEKF